MNPRGPAEGAGSKEPKRRSLREEGGTMDKFALLTCLLLGALAFVVAEPLEAG